MVKKNPLFPCIYNPQKTFFSAVVFVIKLEPEKKSWKQKSKFSRDFLFQGLVFYGILIVPKFRTFYWIFETENWKKKFKVFNICKLRSSAFF